MKFTGFSWGLSIWRWHALLLVVAYLGTENAQATELFESSEVTARIDVLWDAMGALEPAAGSGGHGESKGDKESKKSKSGKDLQGTPALPEVRIGGEVVKTHMTQLQEEAKATLPTALQEPKWQDVLNRRFNISTYAHSPSKGPKDAPVTVIIFADMSCASCGPELIKIDQALSKYASSTQIIDIYSPNKLFQETSVAAFYGKVAARLNRYWDYRERLLQSPPADSSAVFAALMATGVREKDTRELMLNEARRFYRELDADTLLGRSFGVGTPPVVFVNGIRVGPMGVPLEMLGDVMEYVHNRVAAKLPEPPL